MIPLLQYFLDFVSLITIAMCLVLKVPQISILLDTKSASGVSLTSLMLELSSYSVTALYNYVNGYSLLSYFEYPIILVQEYVLIFLVLKYSNLLNNVTVAGAATYFALVTLLLTGFLPKAILTCLIPLGTPISVSSKATQLLAIIKAGNADGVAPKTWFLSAMSNLTRVITIYMDSSDIFLLTNFAVSVFMSASVMFAALYYRRKSTKVQKHD